MGRELKRKQAKKDGKNVREIQKKDIDKPLSPKTLGYILVVLVLFFVTLYVLTGLFITKELNWFGINDKGEVEDIVNIENKILATDSLRQTEEEYYVYYYDTTDEDTEVSSKLYLLSETVYRVDLNDGFNSNFVGEPSGVIENINDLKVSNPTLIKVSSESIVEFYSGAEEIKSAIE